MSRLMEWHFAYFAFCLTLWHNDNENILQLEYLQRYENRNHRQSIYLRRKTLQYYG